jgi:hypothetical protein
MEIANDRCLLSLATLGELRAIVAPTAHGVGDAFSFSSPECSTPHFASQTLSTRHVGVRPDAQKRMLRDATQRASSVAH